MKNVVLERQTESLPQGPEGFIARLAESGHRLGWSDDGRPAPFAGRVPDLTLAKGPTGVYVWKKDPFSAEEARIEIRNDLGSGGEITREGGRWILRLAGLRVLDPIEDVESLLDLFGQDA